MKEEKYNFEGDCFLPEERRGIVEKIIEFPAHAKDKEYSEKVFEWLINRAIEYLKFLRRNVVNSDKSEWCERIIVALKFLGDYKLDKEINSID